MTPPIAWSVFLLVTDQNLSGSNLYGVFALVLIFAWSFVITALGIWLVGVPLTLLARRIFPSRGYAVAVVQLAAGFFLASCFALNEGSVIDFASLISFHIFAAAAIFAALSVRFSKKATHA